MKLESSKVLCRSCAAYHQCKLEKRGTAIKCRNFWEHISTFEFEKAIAHTNRTLAKRKLETVFLLTSSGKSFISSSIVREIISNKGEYQLFVPDAVRV